MRLGRANGARKRLYEGRADGYKGHVRKFGRSELGSCSFRLWSLKQVHVERIARDDAIYLRLGGIVTDESTLEFDASLLDKSEYGRPDVSSACAM